jgi:DNA-binding NtrC family response regulator
MKFLLLVDDDKFTLSSLSEALSQYDENFKIITAENGEEAVNIIEAAHVDLIITDLNMPVKNGLALITYVYKHHPGTPIILMTASDCEEACNALPQFNPDDCITKPFKFEALIELIYSRLVKRSEEGPVKKPYEQSDPENDPFPA